MMAGYAAAGIDQSRSTFELFVRKLPPRSVLSDLRRVSNRRSAPYSSLRFTSEQVDGHPSKLAGLRGDRPGLVRFAGGLPVHWRCLGDPRRLGRVRGRAAPEGVGPAGGGSARRDDLAQFVHRLSNPGRLEGRPDRRSGVAGQGGGRLRGEAGTRSASRDFSTREPLISPDSRGRATLRPPSVWESRPSARWPTPGSRRSSTNKARVRDLRPALSPTRPPCWSTLTTPITESIWPPRDRAADPGDPARQRRPPRRVEVGPIDPRLLWDRLVGQDPGRATTSTSGRLQRACSKPGRRSTRSGSAPS